MELIYFNDYLNKYNYELAVTIGSFDGIHLAHQQLINETKIASEKLNCKSAVITFDPHPSLLFNKDSHYLLTDFETKKEIISSLGVDFLILIPFDIEFASISPKSFVNDYLIKLKVKEVVVGSDFRFGCKGSGTALSIPNLSDNKINVQIVELINYDGEKIGSTKIKNLLKIGEVEKANKLLGYTYYFKGNVIKGNNVGEKIGFPTANIKNDNIKKILKPGVYGVLVYVDNVKYLGMMNIGHNPTCNLVDELSTEVNIFDFNENLYEKEVSICCLCFVRDEMKFNSVDELINQLKSDKEFIINKNHILAIK